MSTPKVKAHRLAGGHSEKHTYGRRATDHYTTRSATDELLSRLDGVRKTGDGEWIARCPAHDDKSPSLSVKQVDDRVLIHDFAGCDASDVVAAVGLSMADLFDRPIEHSRARVSASAQRRQSQALDALKAIKHESIVVMCAAGQMAAGWGIDGDDMDRLHEAHQRRGREDGLMTNYNEKGQLGAATPGWPDKQTFEHDLRFQLYPTLTLATSAGWRP